MGSRLPFLLDDLAKLLGPDTGYAPELRLDPKRFAAVERDLLDHFGPQLLLTGPKYRPRGGLASPSIVCAGIRILRK